MPEFRLCQLCPFPGVISYKPPFWDFPVLPKKEILIFVVHLRIVDSLTFISAVDNINFQYLDWRLRSCVSSSVQCETSQKSLWSRSASWKGATFSSRDQNHTSFQNRLILVHLEKPWSLIGKRFFPTGLICVCHWFLFPRKSPPFPGFWIQWWSQWKIKAGAKKSPSYRFVR